MLQPFMSHAERSHLISELNRCTGFIEFGMGGSTMLAVETSNIQKIVSVDSDAAWIAKLRKYEAIQQAERDGRLSLLWANIGPTAQWGAPADASLRSRWPNYSAAPFKLKTPADLILVDGRFRVACAVASTLERPAATVLIHDFWNRPHYHVTLSVFDVIPRVDTLVTLKRKAFIEEEQIRLLYLAHAYTPA
jgi:hypothetical protein